MVKCKVEAIVCAGLVMLMAAGTAVAQERVTTPVSPQERVTTACRAAEDAFAGGDVDDGCKTLLDALRALDADNAQLIDLTTAPLHLLIFGMCSLMDDEALTDFLGISLEPQANPIDDAVLLFFNLEFRTVEGGRAVLETPVSEQVQRAHRMAQSPHGLVRALGLAFLSWYAPGGIVTDSTRTAFNSMAELCPEAKTSRELLHRLLLVGGGADPAHSEALRDLVNRSDWNPAVQAIMADDPVVDFMNEVAAQSTESIPLTGEHAESTTDATDVDSVAENGVASVLAAAQNHQEAEVRDWCMRFVNANAGKETDNGTSFPEAVQVQCKALTKPDASASKALTNVRGGVQPLEVLRAHHILFKQAFEVQDLDAAGTHVDVLLDTSCAEEPLDCNTRQNALRDAVEYARRLVTAGKYEKALALFERMAKKYPNSYVEKRDQEHVAHIKSVLATLEK